jgi:chromosome segregation ATPase
MDDTDRRLTEAESDIKELFREMRGLSTAAAKTEGALENLLVAIGELKEAVKSLQARPGSWFDKIVGALITALVAGGVAALIGVVVK